VTVKLPAFDASSKVFPPFPRWVQGIALRIEPRVLERLDEPLVKDDAGKLAGRLAFADSGHH
jgi:hypothetical protein